MIKGESSQELGWLTITGIHSVTHKHIHMAPSFFMHSDLSNFIHVDTAFAGHTPPSMSATAVNLPS